MIESSGCKTPSILRPTSRHNNHERLKNIRLEKGMTLEEVHKKTKVHLNILKSIEGDSLAGLSPIYIKGFLKIYCNFLGVDHRDYISEYSQLQKVEAKSQDSSTKKDLKAPSILIPSLKGLISWIPRLRLKTIVIILAVFVGGFILFRITKAISSQKSSPSSGKTRNAVSRAKKAAVGNPKVLPSGMIKVGIRAKQKCYLTLKIDGRTVFQGDLRKGVHETWDAKDKVEFSLNNAGAVVMQINGKDIESIGRRKQAVKGLITRESGLQILK